MMFALVARGVFLSLLQVKYNMCPESPKSYLLLEEHNISSSESSGPNCICNPSSIFHRQMLTMIALFLGFLHKHLCRSSFDAELLSKMTHSLIRNSLIAVRGSGTSSHSAMYTPGNRFPRLGISIRTNNLHFPNSCNRCIC